VWRLCGLVTDQPNNLALVYVSVGSNIEPERHIEAALGLLMNTVAVTAVSTFYRTEPIGRPEQDTYLNGVFEIRTNLPACEVTPAILHPIETKLGRLRSEDKFASRTLDLDLILYNDLETSSPSFSLPHPDIERAFVLGPILELLAREALSHPCKQLILDMLSSQQMSQAIGVPMETFSCSLSMKLSPE
jgi:2-amino-4-hydroxy-6-hydroxymethyldihydropteridine diphosphokinase